MNSHKKFTIPVKYHKIIVKLNLYKSKNLAYEYDKGT